MKQINRQKAIIEELEKNGSVDTVELSEKFNVSSMTIRRDLKTLADEGILTLAHGGAVLNGGSLFEYPMSYKEEQYWEEKKRIAALCCSFINERDSIFLDTGTTTLAIAENLRDKKNIVVTTQSLLVMQALSSAPGIRLISAPGVYRPITNGFLGQLTSNFVKNYKYDTLFLAAEGIDAAHGITVPDVIDAETKKSLIECSQKVIAVLDKSKIGLSFFSIIAPITAIDILVTNEGADSNMINEFKRAGVEVFLV